MKQRTPLQRVLDWVEENKRQIETAHTTLDFVSVRDLRAFIESIKEEEKRMVINAYYAGTSQFANEAEIINPKTPQDYFKEIFEQ